MKLTHEKVKALVEQYPNDLQLGEKIRSIINSSNINEIYVDPNQIDLMDSINEITKNDGPRY